MSHRILLPFSLALAVGACHVPLSAQTPAPGGPPTAAPTAVASRIVTSASEEVEVTPDRAVVTFSVETRARTAAAAGTENARIQTAVLDTLRRLGIASAQLRTQGVSINPEYEYPREGGRPTVVGYQAMNSIQVEVRQVAQIGPVIDAGLSRGATNVGGLRFFASSTEAATRDALKKAVAKARADAEAIAEAAGGRITGVVQISSSPNTPMPVQEMAPMLAMRSMDKSAAPTPIESGTLRFSVYIEAIFVFSMR
ncbi:MAG: SIMPL domain-containing protein [Gemmatimonadaceae bacterium]